MAFKIYYHYYSDDEEYIIHLQVDEVPTVLKDIPPKDKVGYDSWDTTLFRETKKQVFRELYKLEQNMHFQDYNPTKDTDTNVYTLDLIIDYYHPDTRNKYPEIFI